MSDYWSQLRAQVGGVPLMAAGVAAFIVAPGESVPGGGERRLLLCPDGSGSEGEGWSLPGGRIQPGESPADGLARLVRQQTGLHVAPVRLAGVFGGADWGIHTPEGAYTLTCIAFECVTVGGEPGADCAYFSQPEAEQLQLEPVDRALLPFAFAARTGTYFRMATWTPPADGVRANGISPYIRDLRATVGAALLFAVGASALIFDEAGRVLLQRRGDTGGWGALGGALDPYESPADAVVREAWEESGLRVEPVRVVGVYGGADFRVTYPNGDRLAFVVTAFECRAVGGALEPDGHESLDLRYFPVQEALAILPPRFSPRVQHALARSPWAQFEASTWGPG